MKQKIHYLFMLLLMIIAGVGGVKAQNYELVTDASTLVPGDKVVIGIITDDSGTKKAWVAGGIESQYLTRITGSTLQGNTITALKEGTIVFTLGKNEGNWTFANSEGQLLGATAAKKMAWGSGTTTWTISVADGNATIASTNSNFGRILYNVSNPRFLNYTSNTTASMLLVQLFKKVESGPSAEATTLTIDASGITNTDVYKGTAAGSLSATVEASGNAVNGATVTWASSKTDVATIDENGTVTLVAAGTTIITATYAGVDGQYEGSSATYTLTVTSSAPNVQPTTIEANLNNDFFNCTAFTSWSDSYGTTFSRNKDNVTITLTKGESKYMYINTGAIRMYDGNTLTFTAPQGYNITKIVLAGAAGFDANLTAEGLSKGTWTGEASEVVIAGNSNKKNITAATITLAKPSSVKVPTFSLASGTYFEAQSVTLSCETEGATIYYTTDGTEPTAESTEYTEAISISETTTLKAIAIKGEDVSAVASATYTFPTVYSTIAAFKEANTTGYINLTGAQVVYIDSDKKTIYVKDNSGAIALYNKNGFTTELKAGDILSGIIEGKYSPFNNLPEITNISNIGALKATGTEDVVSVVISPEEIADHLCQLVTFAKTDISKNNEKYYTNGNVQLYDSFYKFGELEEGVYRVSGVALVYNDQYEIVPRAEDDIVLIPMVAQIGDNKYETFAEAVTAATEGQTIQVIKAGEYKLPALSANVTIEGAVEGVVFDCTGTENIASVPNGATFKNVTLNFGQENYHGFQHAGAINMEGCTLNGKFFSYGDMTFTNCKFNQTASDYHMWVYGPSTVNYIGCEFTGKGKFLNLYREDAKENNVLVENCTFVSDTKNKAALNVKATSSGTLLKCNVVIKNSTVNENFPEAKEFTNDNGTTGIVLNGLVQVDDRPANGDDDNITITQDDTNIYPIAYEAKVGTKKFKTFAEAVAALTEENNTITLLANIEEAYTLAEGQTLNVIRGEYTLTVLAPDGNILQTAEADGVTTYSYAAPVAKIGETMYASLQVAIDAAKEGETVKLLKDIELEQTETVDGVKKYGARVEKSIIIDGDGHKLSGNANRTIGIKGTDSSNKINVTIKNLNIENAQNGGGAIFTRGNLNSLTLNNVNLILTSTGGGYNQPLTISGNAGTDATNNIVEVKLDGCTLESAPNCEYGYAIINWVPANVEIKNSVIKGWACLYAKPNSKGTTYTVEESELISSNQNAGDWNSFGVIVLEDKDITVNVTNTKIDISGTKNTQSIATFSNYWATASNNSTAGSTVTLGEGNTIIMKDDAQFTVGSVNDGDENGGKLIISGGIFDKPVPEQYCAEGMIPVDLGDGKYGVKLYISAPIIFHDGGVYEDALTVAMAGEGTIKYTLNGGAEQTYTEPITIDATTTIKAWTEQDGAKSDVEEKTFTIVEKTYDGDTFDGYYTIKNNGNKMFVNVAGRKTVTFESETADKAGTVIRVKTNDKGQVEVLRSQGVDVPGYADKAMRYVPKIVQLVVDKLHAEGTGTILGENGLKKIMEKFDASFDEHLYLEEAGDGYRIYGRTPSMKPVVDFYAENKANVDAKLPMLEDFINSAIKKVLEKTEGRGKSILVDFSLHEIWEKMGDTLTESVDTLTEPVDEASTARFYEEVLSSETNVWNFAYQTAMIYWGNLKNNGTFQTYIGKLGDYAKYINKVENIRPNFKYYIVQKDGKMDIISEGNEDIVKNNANTIWTLEDRTEFSVAFNEENVLNNKYYTTLYTDFAYTLPEGVKAYKVTEVSKAGVAKKVEMEGTIPAQTPVLLEADAADTKVLTLSTEDGTAPADNILVGADSLINQYQIKTAQVETLFGMAKEILGESFYNNYVAEYEHLMLRYAGTVNNKYFFGLSQNDMKGMENVRMLNLNDAGENLGFYSNWVSLEANKALIIDSNDPVKLMLKGDVNRSGDVTVADVNALVEIVLGKVTEADDTHDFDAAHVNADKDITIADVTALVNIILGKTQN